MNFQYIVIVGCFVVVVVSFRFFVSFCFLLSCFAFLPFVGSVSVVSFINIILTV